MINCIVRDLSAERKVTGSGTKSASFFPESIEDADNVGEGQRVEVDP